MKLQSVAAFLQYLETQPPCRANLLIVPDAYERRSFAARLLAAFPEPHQFLKGTEEGAAETIVAQLASPSLFAEEPVVCVEGMEKISAKTALADWLRNPAFGFLIGLAEGASPLASLFEKNGLLLDMREEKPWEKEKRQIDQMAQKASQMGKKVAADVWPLLFEMVGKESAFLDSEWEKVLCYVGERSSVTREDIVRIVVDNEQRTLFFFAEEMVWEKRIILSAPFPFSALAALLRSQFLLGKTILSLIASSLPIAEWGPWLPNKLWPRLLEKRAEQAHRLGLAYFEKGLELLFDLELLARTGQVHEEALFTLFGASCSK
ncbi:MAG: hypothetical protein KGI80_00910 [Verrucomicrobiota bacterium]|nr:hypothetical protein [Verrucomicrobiota bacterium]